MVWVSINRRTHSWHAIYCWPRLAIQIQRIVWNRKPSTSAINNTSRTNQMSYIVLYERPEHTHTHTHTHVLSLTLTHSYTFSLSLSHSHSLIFCLYHGMIHSMHYLYCRLQSDRSVVHIVGSCMLVPTCLHIHLSNDLFICHTWMHWNIDEKSTKIG